MNEVQRHVIEGDEEGASLMFAPDIDASIEGLTPQQIEFSKIAADIIMSPPMADANKGVVTIARFAAGGDRGTANQIANYLYDIVGTAIVATLCRERGVDMRDIALTAEQIEQMEAAWAVNVAMNRVEQPSD